MIKYFLIVKPNFKITAWIKTQFTKKKGYYKCRLYNYINSLRIIIIMIIHEKLKNLMNEATSKNEEGCWKKILKGKCSFSLYIFN